jgi:polyphosphate kinase
VQIELQARFETSNISYAEQMQTEGIELILGKGTKGSQQICVIERIENGKVKDTAFISTGNF